jgi:hypothetical protein
MNISYLYYVDHSLANHATQPEIQKISLIELGYIDVNRPVPSVTCAFILIPRRLRRTQSPWGFQRGEVELSPVVGGGVHTPVTTGI